MSEAAFIRCEGLVKIYKVANLEVVALQGLDLLPGLRPQVPSGAPSCSG